VLRDEGELHVDSFAKYAAAFFRMSRSAFSFGHLALELRDLQLLGLHLPVAGKGMLWIGFEAHGDDQAGDAIWVAPRTPFADAGRKRCNGAYPKGLGRAALKAVLGLERHSPRAGGAGDA
jgi:hypothetical protein